MGVEESVIDSLQVLSFECMFVGGWGNISRRWWRMGRTMMHVVIIIVGASSVLFSFCVLVSDCDWHSRSVIVFIYRCEWEPFECRWDN